MLSSKLLVLLLLFSLIGNAYFYYYPQTRVISANGMKDYIVREKKYPLISTRVVHELPIDILINFLPLRTQIRKQLEPYGENVAFYFEYLPTGTSVGVNEKLTFASASLLKVPVVMGTYRGEEKRGLDLDKPVQIEEKHVDKDFGSLWKKKGDKITLREAVRLALTESDNTATRLLMNYVDVEDFEDVYEGLDIDLERKDGFVQLSAKHFSSVLKALYFSSVLSKDDSQEILNMMTQTKFGDKMPAGVPRGTKVAHKIGVLGDELFMDCGVVYVPKRSYLLCLISKSSEEEARMRMKTASKTVYEYVASR